jgi:hypothetical protein
VVLLSQPARARGDVEGCVDNEVRGCGEDLWYAIVLARVPVAKQCSGALRVLPASAGGSVCSLHMRGSSRRRKAHARLAQGMTQHAGGMATHQRNGVERRE